MICKFTPQTFPSSIYNELKFYPQMNEQGYYSRLMIKVKIPSIWEATKFNFSIFLNKENQTKFSLYFQSSAEESSVSNSKLASFKIFN